jgi:hypothetical protein
MHFALLCLFQPLPDVFVGVRLVLPASVTADREELERYFVAYPSATDCRVHVSRPREIIWCIGGLFHDTVSINLKPDIKLFL